MSFDSKEYIFPLFFFLHVPYKFPGLVIYLCEVLTNLIQLSTGTLDPYLRNIHNDSKIIMMAT